MDWIWTPLSLGTETSLPLSLFVVANTLELDICGSKKCGPRFVQENIWGIRHLQWVLQGHGVDLLWWNLMNQNHFNQLAIQ